MANHETHKSSSDRPSTCFDHKFSGHSVWLEPSASPNDDIKATMKELAVQCGGPECGVHDFEPHCTLLYNIDLQIEASTDEGRRERESMVGRELLEKCIAEYEQIVSQQKNDSTKDETITTETVHVETSTKQLSMQLELVPTDYYYFPYPKSADDGRGFGCVISMLLINNTHQLQALHDAAAKVFPKDERHSEAGGKFTPHMALVYAPEAYGEWLDRWTTHKRSESQFMKERNIDNASGIDPRSNYRYSDGPLEQNLLMSMPGGRISIWNSNGSIDQWYMVASIDL